LKEEFSRSKNLTPKISIKGAEKVEKRGIRMDFLKIN
tara:strand:- start:308 stop:418 length:111 start_codon:yes stop_codon:yes gene_type:complete